MKLHKCYIAIVSMYENYFIDKLIIIQRAVINYDIIPSRLASRKMIVYERAVTSQLRSSTYRRVQSWPLSSPSMR